MGEIALGRYYGYNRVSTKDQHLDRGTEAIKKFCQENSLPLTKIFEDKQTGRTFDRPRYIVMKEDVLQPGDTLIIPEYDRLGRADETRNELEYFKVNNVRVIFLDIPTTQTDFSCMSDEMSKAILFYINDILISFFDLMARTELQRKKKRQREGIEAKKQRGEWKDYGRPRIMSADEFSKRYIRVLRGEIGSLALMRELSLNRDTYFRYVREYKRTHCN
ncbi:putative site-specific recombinase (plasmid) [Oscillibacter valericigenes Sjm18-20]|nr:putative site-specific recombinase [Oscillibacter valericigenes Sjm18-20]